MIALGVAQGLLDHARNSEAIWPTSLCGASDKMVGDSVIDPCDLTGPGTVESHLTGIQVQPVKARTSHAAMERDMFTVGTVVPASKHCRHPVDPQSTKAGIDLKHRGTTPPVHAVDHSGWNGIVAPFFPKRPGVVVDKLIFPPTGFFEDTVRANKIPSEMTKGIGDSIRAPTKRNIGIDDDHMIEVREMGCNEIPTSISVVSHARGAMNTANRAMDWVPQVFAEYRNSLVCPLPIQ